MKIKLKSLYHFVSPKHQTIHLDYRVNARSRYATDNGNHNAGFIPCLYDIIDKGRNDYHALLDEFAKDAPVFHAIKNASEESRVGEPGWNNGHLPGLDIIGIYSFLKKINPGVYIEIGSGNSTKVARKSIRTNALRTKITSIDPCPRAEIDELADVVIRKPLENIDDLSFIINSLNENDILFIDNSHRCFPNSDVTVCFLELLPQVRKGVYVHVHDIYLPYDYPQFMCDRFYNEQYVLAAMIQANSDRYKPILPNYFISEDAQLSSVLKPVWEHPSLKGVERHGGSFWLQIGN